MYKLGINAGAIDGADVSAVIPLLSRIGFDSFFTLWSEKLPIDTWAELASKNNIDYGFIHGPWEYANEIWSGSDNGRLAVSRLKSCIDCCSRFDIPVMVVHSFIGFKPAIPTDIGVKLWSEVVEHAEKKGVIVGFENLEGEAFLDTVMTKLGTSPSVRFCWDTGHEHCYNIDTDMMSLYGDKLIATHFNDNFGCISSEKVINKNDDLHLMPFDGDVDWKRVMDKIRAASYNGTITFELKSKDDGVHGRYLGMSCEEFYTEAYKRAIRVSKL